MMGRRCAAASGADDSRVTFSTAYRLLLFDDRAIQLAAIMSIQRMSKVVVEVVMVQVMVQV
ncbi:MAG TPA: hypothetical protein VEM57_05650, partial [Candidatus Binatus sp.]|nr:hypothetical protein [Candidatus Binatus sp.]